MDKKFEQLLANRILGQTPEKMTSEHAVLNHRQVNLDTAPVLIRSNVCF